MNSHEFIRFDADNNEISLSTDFYTFNTSRRITVIVIALLLQAWPV